MHKRDLYHTKRLLHNNKLSGAEYGPIFVSGLKDKFSFSFSYSVLVKESCQTARLFLISDRFQMRSALCGSELFPEILDWIDLLCGHVQGLISIESPFHNKNSGIHNKRVGQVIQNSIFEKSLVKIPNLTCR
jgi:hypothetical protein